MLSNKYYKKGIKNALAFIIYPGKTVLTLRDNNIPPEKYNQKFDYIFLDRAMERSSDLMGLISNLNKYCHSQTRILIYQRNYLWQWIINLSESLHLKRKESRQNWLSIGDISIYFSSCGFEVTRIFKRTLCPVFAFGLGPLINWIGTLLPFFDFFKLDQFILARPSSGFFEDTHKSLSICITVRNEKENIEKIIKTLPLVCVDQEVLFIEGHSSDGTKQEVERIIKKYPDKNIRLIGQPGEGQGDAIRAGFKDAKKDLIILYEGDGTSDPDDLKYFYDTMRAGRFEFIEGSRFVYPLVAETMPLPNKLGNIFFAKWFSFFLGQRTTDVLSGIKAISKKDFDILSEHWGFLGFQDPFGDFELLYGAARMGLKFGEIPMRYYPRVYGSSKSKVFKHGFYLIKMAIKGYLIFRKH
ncbi:MAG: glycosyltransferase family 2 protein [bacterium]|nr:glycosyltransferase family 2 protein [bacterium]